MQPQSKLPKRIPQEELDDLILVLTFCGGLAAMLILKLIEGAWLA